MAFTGVATYEVFSSEIAEDVSSIVTDVSPRVTPFLDWAGDGRMPIVSPQYSWEEKNLLPETFAVSSAVSSSAAAAYGVEFGANAQYLRVQDILRNETSAEYIKVVSIGASTATIYVKRAYAGTSATSKIVAGGSFYFVGSAVEEGSDIRTERRVNHTLASNYIQNYREDIKVSRIAKNAGLKASAAPNIYDEAVIDSSSEVLKQLERSVLMGRASGNSIGASGVETTMAGIYYSIATNVTSNATLTVSIANSWINNVLAYTEPEENESDYCIWAGNTAYRAFNALSSSEVRREALDASRGIIMPTMFYSAFGNYQVKRTRYLPAGSMIFVRRDLIDIANFAGLSFQTREYDNGTSSQTGYVEGTYGLRFKNETHAARFDGIS